MKGLVMNFCNWKIVFISNLFADSPRFSTPILQSYLLYLSDSFYRSKPRNRLCHFRHEASESSGRWVCDGGEFRDYDDDEDEYSSPAQSSPRPQSSVNFEKDRHLVYLEMMYELLPYHYQSQEINRLTLAP